MLVNGVCDVYNTLQIDSIAVKKKTHKNGLPPKV